MMYISPMTIATSSDFPSFHICTNCGHEHQAIDLEDIVILDAEGYVRQVLCADEIKDGTTVLCADEDACERRMGRMEPLPDFGPDPEERSLSTDHLEEQASARYEDRYGSWDDHDGQDDDSGWDD
jgi:hypothetical protein